MVLQVADILFVARVRKKIKRSTDLHWKALLHIVPMLNLTLFSKVHSITLNFLPFFYKRNATH